MKGKLSPRSYPIQGERKYSFFSLGGRNANLGREKSCSAERRYRRNFDSLHQYGPARMHACLRIKSALYQYGSVCTCLQIKSALYQCGSVCTCLQIKSALYQSGSVRTCLQIKSALHFDSFYQYGPARTCLQIKSFILSIWTSAYLFTNKKCTSFYQYGSVCNCLQRKSALHFINMVQFILAHK